MNPVWLIRAGLLWQATVFAQSFFERQSQYKQAREYADAVGKPLVVVGGPYGAGWLSFIRRSGIFQPFVHGSGDVCYDREAGACQGSPHYILGDIRDMSVFPSKTFGAAFASHILEHMPTVEDCIQAWNELHRVADKVFVCVPSRQSVHAWLIHDHYLWVDIAEDKLYIEERQGGHRNAVLTG